MLTVTCYNGGELVDWLQTDQPPNIGATIGTLDTQSGEREPKWTVVGYLDESLTEIETPTSNVLVVPIEG